MKWLSHVIGALKMALTWAIFWGIMGAIIAVVSGLIGIPDGVGLDPWIALATPGFFGGIIFYIIFQVLEDEEKFYNLPLVRLARLGVITGGIMAVLPFLLGSSNVDFSPWLLFLMILGMTTTISVVTAVVTTMVFKKFRKGE